jgi:hypothetical protein
VVVGELVVVDVVVVVAPTKFSTETGKDLFVLVPSPICPYVLSPQHLISPLLKRTHEFLQPPVSASTADVRPCTLTGVFESLVVPSPN